MLKMLEMGVDTFIGALGPGRVLSEFYKKKLVEKRKLK